MDSIATTRIDLQKLQLLNDRICQCLDALNQVRLSAHAPNYAPGYVPGFAPGYVPQFTGVPFHGVNPYFSAPYAHTPYYTAGYQTFPLTQWGYTPSASPVATGMSPMSPVSPIGASANGHIPSYAMAW